MESTITTAITIQRNFFIFHISFPNRKICIHIFIITDRSFKSTKIFCGNKKRHRGAVPFFNQLPIIFFWKP